MTHLELIKAANVRIMESEALQKYEEVLLEPALYCEETEQSKQYLHWLIEASEQDLIDYGEMEIEFCDGYGFDGVLPYEEYDSPDYEECEAREHDWDRWQDEDDWDIDYNSESYEQWQ